MTPYPFAAWRRRHNASGDDTIILVIQDVVLSLNAEQEEAQFKLVKEDALSWWQHAKDDFSGNVWWRRIL